MNLHATFSLAAIGLPPDQAAMCAADSDLMACVHDVAVHLPPSATMVLEFAVGMPSAVASRLRIAAAEAVRLDGLGKIRAALDEARRHARSLGQLSLRVAVRSRESWWRECLAWLAAWWKRAAAQ